MLSAKDIVEHKAKKVPDFPQIGLKEFEPSNSSFENAQIESNLTKTKEVLSFETVRLQGSLVKAIWVPEICLAEVTTQTGSHWQIMGHMINGNMYIYPEEALYLLEAGSLEITYENVPLSIQRAYSVLLAPKTDISIEKYRVYAHLFGNGYKVVRHCPGNILTPYERQLEVHKAGILHKRPHKPDNEEQVKKLKTDDIDKKNDLHLSESSKNTGPAVCGVEFLEKLQIFNTQGNTKPGRNLEVTFDVYQSCSSKIYKKSAVQLPDFRVLVMSYQDLVPLPSDLAQLQTRFPDSVKLLTATVFPDFISYYQLSSIPLPSITDVILP